MRTPIPASSQKRLLRLISARTDMVYAASAFRRFMAADGDEEKYHFLVSMVLAYCRPFTNNDGIGSLKCEYPTFPDFTDAELNERHERMRALRNRFLGHSSIEGTRVWLLAPGSVHPATRVPASGYDYAVAKLHFMDSDFAAWLHDIVAAVLNRLDSEIPVVCKEIGSNYLRHGELCIMDSGKPFKWAR